MKQIADGAWVVMTKEGISAQKGVIMWYVRVEIWQATLQKTE